jgi:hypothetical protein
LRRSTTIAGSPPMTESYRPARAVLNDENIEAVLGAGQRPVHHSR